MKTMIRGMCVVAALVWLTAVSGCGSQPSKEDASGTPAANGHEHGDHGHEYAEEHEGPHGGHVIELGHNHEYHAELVDNEKDGTVTVYLLDKDLKELAIDQSTIAMNLTVDGKPKTFELKAADATDGKATRFDTADRALFEALHEHDAAGKLRVTIDGTPVTGSVEHHHHEHGHDHKH